MTTVKTCQQDYKVFMDNWWRDARNATPLSLMDFLITWLWIKSDISPVGNISLDCSLGGIRYSLVDTNIRSFQHRLVAKDTNNSFLDWLVLCTTTWEGPVIMYVMSKGPFTQAIFVAATRCNFCRTQVATPKSHAPGAIFSAICHRDIAGVSNMFGTCCNFSAIKIASNCRNKNRLCKRALMLPVPARACQPYLLKTRVN